MYSVTFVTQPNRNITTREFSQTHPNASLLGMSSIDMLALTCRVLYDQRVLEQRKEIEMLEVKYFFRGYTPKYIKDAMRGLNYRNIKCKCGGCKIAERMYADEIVDEEAACTFGPWFDNVLQERGFVVLRRKDQRFDYSVEPYDDDYDDGFEFPDCITCGDDIDCHLFENITDKMEEEGNTDVRWGEVCIGERLWSAESINNEWVKKFKRIFCDRSPPSSPPTPPASPKMAPQPPPLLPITATINQGLELQELKKQLATKAAEIQTLKEQLAETQLELDRNDNKRKRP